MTEPLSPVGIFVPDDNYDLIARLIEPGSNVKINDPSGQLSIEIFIGDSDYLRDRVKKNKNCFVMTEPPEIQKYESEFLNSFDFIAGPQFSYLGKRENLLVFNPIIPHFVGVQFPLRDKPKSIWRGGSRTKSSNNSPIIKLSVSEILELKMQKKKSLTAIVSSKKMTPQQVDRINFIKFLERNSKIPIQIYGGITSPIDDKLSALMHSTHHISIENSAHNDYWTEKFADSLLALNYTFYCGAPNLDNYFDNSVFSEISLNNYKVAQSVIEESFLHQPVDLEKLISARTKLVRDYSLMGLIRRITPLL